MTVRLAMMAAPALVALALMASRAGAVDSDSNPPPPTPTSQSCKSGEIWDKQKKKCVRAQSGLFDDDTLYEAGRELAYAGRYDEAIAILMLAKDRSDPRILNYLGFSHRSAGRIQTGLGFYRKAIRRDPDYVLARSYMGQALILIGDRPGAVAELAEIGKRAGKRNWPYRALAAALSGGNAAAGY
jgi:tetratricopeptide (TPR) repeat protein